jgi:predicted amidohydrolase YtcJ
LPKYANGDCAIDNVLDALEAVQSKGVEVQSLRPSIEHCSILHDEQIARMKELGVRVGTAHQPCFSDIPGYLCSCG